MSGVKLGDIEAATYDQSVADTAAIPAPAVPTAKPKEKTKPVPLPDPSEPSNVAERALIGALLQDGAAYPVAVSAGVVDESFTDAGCRDAWVAVRRLHENGKPVDPLTVSELMRGDQGENLLTLGEWMDDCPTAVNAGSYAAQVAVAHRRERLRTAARLAVETLGRGGDVSVVAAQLREAGEAAEVGGADALAVVDDVPFVPFPVECFPGAVADYDLTVAESNCVDPCAPALAILVVAGAAMGNAFRLRLKRGFAVPPLLWGCVVGRTGTNKTAPMREVVEPLRVNPPMPQTDDPILANRPLLCPPSRGVIGDATSAAVIHRLAAAPRGLLSFRDELAAWVKEFDAYKKGAGGGGDEQFWLKAWDADHYQLDRKTDNEQKDIYAAAVSILGGMQPSVLERCFDPSKYASGLVPRLLPVYPPEKPMRWSEAEISDEARASWKQIIDRLRFHPFAAFVPAGPRYEPNVIGLSPEAHVSFVESYNELGKEMESMDESRRIFAAKAKVMVARLALILHGLETVTGRGDWSAPVSRPTMDAAVTMGRWFLNEQFRVYGIATLRHDRQRADEVAAWVKTQGGRTTARDLQRSNNRRYHTVEPAKLDLQRLVEVGRGRWDGNVFVLAR